MSDKVKRLYFDVSVDFKRCFRFEAAGLGLNNSEFLAFLLDFYLENKEK